MLRTPLLHKKRKLQKSQQRRQLKPQLLPRKRQKTAVQQQQQQQLPCYPFDRDRPPPDQVEQARLWALSQDGDAWVKERLKRMGASSCSCAVGLGPATPWDYWKLKTHRIEREDTEEGYAIMERGHRLEPLAADLYEVVMESGPLQQVGIKVHPVVPWIHCSPDRMIANNPEGCVELKCPMYALPVRIPDKYMCQVQQQMACLDVQWCDLFYYLHDDERDCAKGVTCWRIWRSEPYWDRMLQSFRVMADCLMEDRQPTEKDIPLRPVMPPVKTQLLVDWNFDDYPDGQVPLPIVNVAG